MYAIVNAWLNEYRNEEKDVGKSGIQENKVLRVAHNTDHNNVRICHVVQQANIWVRSREKMQLANSLAKDFKEISILEGGSTNKWRLFRCEFCEYF